MTFLMESNVPDQFQEQVDYYLNSKNLFEGRCEVFDTDAHVLNLMISMKIVADDEKLIDLSHESRHFDALDHYYEEIAERIKPGAPMWDGELPPMMAQFHDPQFWTHDDDGIEAMIWTKWIISPEVEFRALPALLDSSIARRCNLTTYGIRSVDNTAHFFGVDDKTTFASDFDRALYPMVAEYDVRYYPVMFDIPSRPSSWVKTPS